MRKYLPWLIIALTIAAIVVMIWWAMSSPPLEMLLTVDIGVGMATLGILIVLFFRLEYCIERSTMGIEDGLERNRDRIIRAIEHSGSG